jgi:hypothetical protein
MNTDAIGGVLGLALTLSFWFGRGSWSPLSAMFPNTVIVTLGLLSLGLLIKSFVRPTIRPVFADGSRLRIVLTAVVLFAWIASMRFAGFYLSSVVFFAVMTVYIAAASRRVTLRNVGVWVVIVAAEVAVLHFVFANLLAVRLPQGPFAP